MGIRALPKMSLTPLAREVYANGPERWVGLLSLYHQDGYHVGDTN